MSAPTAGVTRKREMKLLSLGLPRSGTSSITQALSMLGFEDVHHGVKYSWRGKDWEILGRAADATFANLQTYRRAVHARAMGRAVRRHDAAADVAAFFGETLIEVYTEAKVLLVVRDFESWLRSFGEIVLQTWWGPFNTPFVRFVEPLAGSCSGTAVRKIVMGLFGSRTVDEARARAREADDRHHRTIREAVPPERLLVYKLGDSW